MSGFPSRFPGGRSDATRDPPLTTVYKTLYTKYSRRKELLDGGIKVLHRVQLDEADPGIGSSFGYKSLAASVSDWIAEEIISGRLAAGHRLTETELADRLGISRSPVREALRKLSSEGLVKIIPRRGAQVAGMEAREASDLYEARLLLEPYCCRLSVEVLSDVDLSSLESIFREMGSAIDQADDERFLEFNVAYHKALVSPCPNEVLRSLVELTWSRSERYWRVLRLLPAGHMRASYRRHKRIHKSVQQRDAEAVEKHVRDLLQFTLDQLEKNLTFHRRISEGDQPAEEPAGGGEAADKR